MHFKATTNVFAISAPPGLLLCDRDHVSHVSQLVGKD